MEQERGCGLGCGVMLLVVVVVGLCLVMPWIGLPLGMVLVTVAMISALVSSRLRRSRDGEEEPDREEDPRSTKDIRPHGGDTDTDER